MSESPQKKSFPGRGKSLAGHEAAGRRQQQQQFGIFKPNLNASPTKAAKPMVPKPAKPSNVIADQKQYKIIEKQDHSTKVVLKKNQIETKHAYMPGTGKVLGSLNAPAGRSASHNVQVVRTVNNNPPAGGRPFSKPNIGTAGGKRQTGGQNAQNQQWRCKVCKFANPTYEVDKETLKPVEPKVQLTKCQRCRDPKQVMKEESLQTGAVRIAAHKPTLQQQRAARGFVKEEKKKEPETSAQQPGAPNIMTMAEMQRQNMSDKNKPMGEQRRKLKESEDVVLKKIAHAEAVNKGLVKGPMGTMQRIHDRDYVAMFRNPGQVNAYNYQKEYGEVLK